MSNVGSVEGNRSAMQFELLRRAQQGERTGGPRPPRPEAMNSEEGTEHLLSMIQSRAEALGMDAEKVSALHDDVKNAVMDALSKQDSDDPEATRSAVESAILTTLEANGIDTSQLKADMEAHHGKGPGPPPGGGPPPDGFGQGASPSDAMVAAAGTSVNSMSLRQLTNLFPLVDEQA